MLKVDIKSFSYADKEILNNISFYLDRGEHLSVLGESGCGKSTLLHLIYGLLHLEHGSLSWDDTQLLGPHHNLIPGESFMKLVAQEFNVMPFISVADNIATHLSRLHTEADQRRVSTLLEVVDLVAFKDIKVKNLSGGQKQRVALAKALANKPKVLLLDEPFSNIDSFRKNKLRRKLFNFLKEQHITCITATHDSEEALAFSDQILMLKGGRKELFGTPEVVYHSVTTPYQAGFFGEVSVIPAGILSEETLVLLPHQLSISEEKTALKIVVQKVYFKGSLYLVEAHSKGVHVFFNTSKALSEGMKCYLKIISKF